MTITISKNKILIMLICLLLVLNISIFSTMAWMTDTSEVTNTFTVGMVDIEVEETDVDEDGKKDLNNYHLIPGEEYTKDPTMTVKAKSESSYVRMIMTVEGWSAVDDIIKDRELENFFAFLDGWDKNIWSYKGAVADKDKDTMSFEFRHNGTVSGFEPNGEGKDNVLPALFTKLKVPGELTMGDLDKLKAAGFKMIIEGHAIQAAGFDNEKDENGDVIPAEDAAWAAFTKEEDKE